jgi:type II secretory pathway component PulK
MRRKLPRKGLALIMALVALAVVTILMTIITSQVVAHRNIARQRQRQLQADWLTRAGVESAVAQLLQSAEPKKDQTLELTPGAVVRVHVEKTGDVFSVKVETEVGIGEARNVKRNVERRYRRNEKDGVIHIELSADNRFEAPRER